MKIRRETAGFTLIEVLVSLFLVGGILIGMSSYLSFLVDARVKNQIIAEVESQGTHVMNLIEQEIRNAQGISTPILGAENATLFLDDFTAANDPTLFSIANGGIVLSEGAPPTVSILTSSKVEASNLNFANVSRLSTPGVIRASFTLSYINTSGNPELSYSKNFETSVNVRTP
ncbi:type II secretion system protein [Candidatus Peregrinibacteria bacterium]|nr:type II secretion system protein [Candidatus Peregrinibacteria bacterium]